VKNITSEIFTVYVPGSPNLLINIGWPEICLHIVAEVTMNKTWVFLLAISGPASASLIHYRMDGTMQYLDTAEPEIRHEITIDFVLDTSYGRWTEMSVFFFEDNWVPAHDSPRHLEVFSDEPDGAWPVYWLTWEPVLTNGAERMVFQGFPEWKLPYTNPYEEPLAHLEKSFNAAQQVTIGKSRFGFSGGIEKVSRVKEPASLILLILGLLIFTFHRFRYMEIETHFRAKSR
jgi:hypothetical protein